MQRSGRGRNPTTLSERALKNGVPFPGKHARSADCAPVPSRGGPRHEIGAKTQRAQGGGLFDKELCAAPAPDVRPSFVSGTGSRRPLMAETRLLCPPRFSNFLVPIAPESTAPAISIPFIPVFAAHKNDWTHLSLAPGSGLHPIKPWGLGRLPLSIRETSYPSPRPYTRNTRKSKLSLPVTTTSTLS
jgi:hypothetical protein